MSQGEINQNLVPNQIDLKALLDMYQNYALTNLNCHHIGTVQSFNALKQTAEVTLNYKRSFFSVDDVGKTTTTLKDWPLIVEAPCVVLGGGSAFITFPIEKGDECLVLFNDRDLDVWFSGSSSSAVSTARLHAYNDALVLVGVRSLANVVTDYNTDAAEFRSKDGTVKFSINEDAAVVTYGDNTISIDATKMSVSIGGTVLMEVNNAGKFKVTNTVGEFVAAIVKLFQDVQSGTTVTAPTGPIAPLLMPTFVADLVKLQSFKA